MGLLAALELTDTGRRLGADLVSRLFQQGLIANFAGGEVLRFLPPLVVCRAEIDEAVDILDQVLAEASGAGAGDRGGSRTTRK